MDIVKKNDVSKIAKIFLIALLGTLLLTLSAKIKIPFYPVPMTMQTFMVLFIGITLGSKVGLFTVSLYLLEGIIGLPVFANSPEKGVGLLYFTGPTMGYLIGFLFSVYLVGSFKFEDSFKDVSKIFKNFVKLLIAVSFIYLLGLLWLGFIIGWDKPIIHIGALPFLPAELFKILILAIIVGPLKRIKKIT